MEHGSRAAHSRSSGPWSRVASRATRPNTPVARMVAMKRSSAVLRIADFSAGASRVRSRACAISVAASFPGVSPASRTRSASSTASSGTGSRRAPGVDSSTESTFVSIERISASSTQRYRNHCPHRGAKRRVPLGSEPQRIPSNAVHVERYQGSTPQEKRTGASRGIAILRFH